MNRYSIEDKRKTMEIVLNFGLPPQIFIDEGHALRQYEKGNKSKLSTRWMDILVQALKARV